MPNEPEAGQLFGHDEDAEFYRWYGAWQPLRPAEVAAMMAGVDVPWWIIGGWAVDAFTHQTREHEDIDVSFFADDLPAVAAHLSADYCLWSNVNARSDHCAIRRPARGLQPDVDQARRRQPLAGRPGPSSARRW